MWVAQTGTGGSAALSILPHDYFTVRFIAMTHFLTDKISKGF
jgi:hypothetical protein